MNQPTAADQAKQPDKQQLQFLRGRARAFERSGMLESADQIHSEIEALQFPAQTHRNAAAAKAKLEEARAEQLRMKQEADQTKEKAQTASPVVEAGGIDAFSWPAPPSLLGKTICIGSRAMSNEPRSAGEGA
ncbi:hypothetical protein [Arthrobacter rhombi]|uniref:hypothetical protein n=1 Tax=Arthrobacter rhombi TaxID=71253 RepID=UPI003FD244A8